MEASVDNCTTLRKCHGIYWTLFGFEHATPRVWSERATTVLTTSWRNRLFNSLTVDNTPLRAAVRCFNIGFSRLRLPSSTNTEVVLLFSCSENSWRPQLRKIPTKWPPGGGKYSLHILRIVSVPTRTLQYKHTHRQTKWQTLESKLGARSIKRHGYTHLYNSMLFTHFPLS